ncbi:MAG: ABC transporter substrate-binding protein, partial [Chloroflexi bacterium]|nr:ABC transporter substrate-binding protein [Chloroflexota bacterium]
MNLDISAGAVTERLKQATYDRLVQRDFVNYYDIPPTKPQLAEKWDMSSDGLTWTFQLRKGVKFHDGTPWNAAAAKFIIDRDSDETVPQYYKIGAGAMKANLG